MNQKRARQLRRAAYHIAQQTDWKTNELLVNNDTGMIIWRGPIRFYRWLKKQHKESWRKSYRSLNSLKQNGIEKRKW